MTRQTRFDTLHTCPTLLSVYCSRAAGFDFIYPHLLFLLTPTCRSTQRRTMSEGEVVGRCITDRTSDDIRSTRHFYRDQTSCALLWIYVLGKKINQKSTSILILMSLTIVWEFHRSSAGMDRPRSAFYVVPSRNHGPLPLKGRDAKVCNCKRTLCPLFNCF